MTRPSPHKPWSVAALDEAVVQRLAQATGLSDVAARVLVARGITDIETASLFLDPDLDRDWLPPAAIPGMTEAAQRVASAVARGERIVVFGDFDLDGVSAAAVATRGLAAMGAEVHALVPHRFREGYGLSGAAIERVSALGPSLVVTVDCGVSSAVEVEMLQQRGIDVVVTDHHEPGELVPVGVPVANPKLEDDNPSRHLAGAGVALKLVQAVGEIVGRPATWRSLLDLATLGTIADIVPLVGENRALVAEGIASMRRAPRVCISALAGAAKIATNALTSGTVAFSLAPRLNAAGRMADPQVALDLLLADEPTRAEELAVALEEHNRIRQTVEAELMAAALEEVHRSYDGERAVVVAGEGWHEGVKGIVASRLTQTFGVPSFLFTIEQGVARGSGRSVGSIDLFEVVSGCAEVLHRFGGHSAAVGLTLAAQDIPRFTELLLAQLDRMPSDAFATALVADASVALDRLGLDLGAELQALEPFGSANPKPLFSASGVFMNGRERVGRGSEHLKFLAFDGVVAVPAIAFRCRDIERLSQHESSVDVLFEFEVDEWRGRPRTQLIVRDVAPREPVACEARSADLVEELFARADEIIAREEYAGIEDAPSFHTKLAGVTFEDRQAVLRDLSAGTPLRLKREPDNEHDPNACAVFDAKGRQIGYLNRRLASALAPALDAEVEYDIEVADVTGGEAGRSLGVNVLMTRRDAAQQEDDATSRQNARDALAGLPADRLETELVRRFIGDRALHEAQVRALASLGAGENTLAVMATGRGKSLIFHLHAARSALKHDTASVFVYPLRALVADQAFHLAEQFTAVGLSVRTVTGESSEKERQAAFCDLASGALDTVLTTPEFLHFHAARFAESSRVGFVVVDEAHHVGLARAGHRPAYARMRETIEALGSPRVLAVTATASDDVAGRIIEDLDIRSVVYDPTVRENLAIEDRRGTADKDGYVAALVARGGKTVVYVNSRERSVQIARMLRKRVPELGFNTAFYNGGLSRSVRHAVERAFRVGDLQVVVSTSAFGEGVNIPDIRNVVLYHLPFNQVEFNQMSGRAGRDGEHSTIHLLYGDKDARLNERILSSLAPDREDLAVLYRVLRDHAAEEGAGFEVTNSELCEQAARARAGFGLDERGVSSAVGIFRDLGLVIGEGHGAYRRLTVVESPERVDLTASVRYAEGLDEIAEFSEFKSWALQADSPELLMRFNRPILPSSGTA